MPSDARISTGLPGHPKTKKVIRRLGEGGAWYTVCLFLWAAANRPDGNLSGMTSEDIELSVDWRGEPDAFVAALSECGFLDGEDGSYRIHDWAEHNPWAAGADARSERAKFAALCKQYGRKEAARMMPEYARSTESDSSEHQNRVPGSASGTGKSAKGSAKPPDKSATGTIEQCSNVLVAAKTSAPSPSPSPSPRAEEREKPTAPDKPVPDDPPAPPASPPPAKTPKRGLMKLDTWLATLGDADAIPADDPIFGYARQTGIPVDFLELSWLRFCEDMRQRGKLQRDWRAHYRNAVRSNWFKLWWFAPDGSCQLTTTGEQARRAAA